ncbi:uncharacterized protein [Epargyreus clarus]|uniref:uncharacterized protein n=1 Tax=Epargyreus clarus TaxID=520877 RepID=UPI003C2D14CC
MPLPRTPPRTIVTRAQTKKMGEMAKEEEQMKRVQSDSGHIGTRAAQGRATRSISRASFASLAAARQLEFEAAKSRAEIELKEAETEAAAQIALRKAKIEKELLEKKLAADLAMLDSASIRDSETSHERVQDWLESAAAPGSLPDRQLMDHAGMDTQCAMAELTKAIKDAVVSASSPNNNNQELLSRLATSKDLPLYAGDPLEWLQFKEAFESSTPTRMLQQLDYLRSPQLLAIITSKLPTLLITKWAEYAYHKEDIPKLELLSTFLYEEAQKVAAAGVSHIYYQSDTRIKPYTTHNIKYQHHHPVLACADASDSPNKCNFCRRYSHKLMECVKFKRALRKDRWRYVRLNKLCFKCLGARHEEHTTCTAENCDIDSCGGPHHRLLHWTRTGATRQEPTAPVNDAQCPERDRELVAHATAPQCSELSVPKTENKTINSQKIYLKIVPVTVFGPKQNINTYALLDDGATVSLISADIADKAGLHGESVTLRATSAWDSGELDQMPDAVHAIQNNQYMDDYIDSFSDKSVTSKIIKDISFIQKQGGFEMHGWLTNEPSVLSDIPKDTLNDKAIRFNIDNQPERTLGLLWFPSDDMLAFDLSFKRIVQDILLFKRIPTKRETLSIVMSIFDIHGYLAPFTVNGKILIRETWKKNIQWDDELDKDLYDLFKKWIGQAKEINNIRIPRWYFRGDTMNTSDSESVYELHIFCDASPSAYAAVAYWRKQTVDGCVRVAFIASKCKVTPTKSVSIPRLELQGAVLACGRIENAQGVDQLTKQPIILDGKDYIARLIVKHYHVNASHSGNEMVVNEMRQKYWLLKLRPTIRSVARQCLICQFKRASPRPPRLGDLPECRLTQRQRPFTMCGVDLFGPIEVAVGRQRHHRYGVLFTCLTVRAVHLEVVSSLTTDSLIMALRRMAARRGWPHTVFSDNGTNLRGANTELKKAYQEVVSNQQSLISEALNKGVQWKFIPPGSPHMGGAWERLIRSVKTALRVVLKQRAPKEETLNTFLCEVERSWSRRVAL